MTPAKNRHYPLWAPLLTHYDEAGAIDTNRIRAQAFSYGGDLNCFMLGGSTGDGWELDDGDLDALLDLAGGEMPERCRIVFGALRPDTAGVVARVAKIEAAAARAPALASRLDAIAVCPPVGAEVSQEQIAAHYQAVHASCATPIAVYQLPQVTGCRISPEGFAALARLGRVSMFKDSSGEDEVARSGLDFGDVLMLRGAEGGYAAAVMEGGGYQGWLLSSANALAGPLRRMGGALADGRVEEAQASSHQIEKAVLALFAAAADEVGANTFSNANRAADHIRAHGSRWEIAALPNKIGGKPLSREILSRAAKCLAPFIDMDEPGYLEG